MTVKMNKIRNNSLITIKIILNKQTKYYKTNNNILIHTENKKLKLYKKIKQILKHQIIKFKKYHIKMAFLYMKDM
jgi:hypothetical protein